jgi:hypothetical protein
VLAERVMAALTAGLGDAPRRVEDLPGLLWPTLTAPGNREVLAVWMQLFVRGEADDLLGPLARSLATAWLDWLAVRVDAPTSEARLAAAARVIALLDGALLLRHVGLVDVADSAVTDPLRPDGGKARTRSGGKSALSGGS